MVVAVRCPNVKCRKYMLVEDADQGNVVPCLICKQNVRVPANPATVAVAPPPPAADLSPIFDDDEPKFTMD